MRISHLVVVVLGTFLAVAPAQTISLTPNTPVTLNPTALNTPISYAVSTFVGTNDVIGLSSAGSYDLSLTSPAVTSNQPGNNTEFLVAPTLSFSPTLPAGLCSPLGTTLPLLPGVLDWVTPEPVPNGALASTFVPAGRALKVLQMTSPGPTASFNLVVTGDPSLKWYLFSSSSSTWRPRSQRVAEGVVGGSPFNFNSGTSASSFVLVVAQEGGVSATNRPFAAKFVVSGTSLILNGAGSSVSNIAAGNHGFFVVPQAGRWNAIGAFGSISAGYTIFIGNVHQLATSSTGFAVANGRIGAITPTQGLLSLSSFMGGTGTLNQATAQALTIGTSGSRNWFTADLIHIFEFEIQTAGIYNLNVTGPSGLAWQTYAPGSAPTWRSKSSFLTSTGVGTPQNFVSLSPGWHAIVVSKSSGAPSGSVTCTVSPSPNNPVPVLNSISPASANAGGAGFTLTANGSQFVSGGSVIRWNGAALPTTFVNAGQLTATVSASLLAAGGTANVTVFSGAPAGGSSGTQTFSIISAAPTLSSLAPASALAGTSAFTLNLNGSGFHPATAVFWNGASLTPSFVSANQLTVNVSANLISVPGSADVRVFNGAPGGGLSSGLAFSIVGPTISSLVPSSIPILTASSQSVNILIFGSDFLPTAQAFADSSPLPTVVFGSTLIQAGVGPSVLGALRRGAVAIAVQNSQASPSNAIALPVGGGNNQGTIVRHPLNPNPGQAYGVELESGAPNAPFLLIVDVLNPAPLFPFPDPVGNFVLSVRPLGPGQPNWFLLTDSIGVYGTPFGPTYDAFGKVFLGGFSAPNPTVGVSLTVEGAFFDPTSATGYRITWPRFPDVL